jgi:hypothetical protein
MIGWVRIAFVVFLGTVLLSACEREALARHAQIETLPSGMTRVTNDGVGEWTQDDAWTLEEDLRLGTIDQQGPELFSRISSIITDGAGRIYVLDAQTQEIRIFAPSGEHVRTIGGVGQGPGELTGGAAGLDWGPDGTLWVYGATGGRHTVIDTLGAEVARYARVASGIVRPWSGGFLGDGRYVDWGGDRESRREQVGERIVSHFTGLTTYIPLAFTPPDRWDTLPRLEYMHPVTSEGDLVGPTVAGPQKSLALFVALDGIWFAHPDEYTIRRRSPEGDTLLAFSMPNRPMVVSPAEIDSVVAAATARGQLRRRENYYATRRLVMRILTDGAGHVYVFPQEEGLPQGTAVDVFTDAGVYEGRIRFPQPILVDAPSPHVTADHVYAVLQDELDVHYLVRYRIVPP